MDNKVASLKMKKQQMTQ